VRRHGTRLNVRVASQSERISLRSAFGLGRDDIGTQTKKLLDEEFKRYAK